MHRHGTNYPTVNIWGVNIRTQCHPLRSSRSTRMLWLRRSGPLRPTATCSGSAHLKNPRQHKRLQPCISCPFLDANCSCQDVEVPSPVAVITAVSSVSKQRHDTETCSIRVYARAQRSNIPRQQSRNDNAPQRPSASHAETPCSEYWCHF